MALRLGSLFVSLGADTSGLSKGLADGAKQVEKFAKQTKEAASQVASAAGIMSALGVAAVKLASTFDGPAASAMQNLEKSGISLAVQVSDVLLPAVKELTSIFNQAARVVAGLSPEVKAAASHFAVIGVEVAAAAKGLQLFMGVLAPMAKAFQAVFSVLSGIGLGALLEIVVVIGAVVGAVVLVHKAWRENWGGIQEATKSVLEWLKDGFSGFANFLKSVWDFLIDGAANWVNSLLDVGSVIEKLTGKKLGVDGLREGFAGLFKDLKSGDFVSEGFKFGKTLGESMVDGVKNELSLMSKELGIDALIAKARGMMKGATPRAAQNWDVTVGSVDHGGNQAGAGFMKMIDEARGNLNAFSIAIMKSTVTLAEEARIRAAQTTGDYSKLTTNERNKAVIDTGGMNFSQATAAQANAEIEMRRAQEQLFAASEIVNVNDRAAAMKAGNEMLLKSAADVAKTAKAKIDAAFKTIGSMLLSSGGAFAQSISNVVQAGTSGGPWAAVIAAILEVIKQTKAFAKFLNLSNYAMKYLGEAAEPLAETIMPVISKITAVVTKIIGGLVGSLGPIFQAITEVLNDIVPIIEVLGSAFKGVGAVLKVIGGLLKAIFVALGPVFRVVFTVIQGVLVLILGLISVIMDVWNGIIAAVAEIAGVFSADAKKEVLKATIDKSDINGALDELSSSTWESAQANASNTAATMENAAAQDAASQAAQSVAESFQNVPTGYKVALRQFNAAAAGVGGGVDGGTILGTDTKAGNGHTGAASWNAGDVTIGTVNITTGGDDPVETWKQIQVEAKKERSKRYGNPYSKADV